MDRCKLLVPCVVPGNGAGNLVGEARRKSNFAGKADRKDETEQQQVWGGGIVAGCSFLLTSVFSLFVMRFVTLMHAIPE